MRNDSLIIGGFVFEQTSAACPEQYDVYDYEGILVGYVRLRSGRFLCQAVDKRGVYHDMVRALIHQDGAFNDEAERVKWLTICVDALRAFPEWEERLASFGQEDISLRDDNRLAK